MDTIIERVIFNQRNNKLPYITRWCNVGSLTANQRKDSHVQARLLSIGEIFVTFVCRHSQLFHCLRDNFNRVCLAVFCNNHNGAKTIVSFKFVLWRKVCYIEKRKRCIILRILDILSRIARILCVFASSNNNDK